MTQKNISPELNSSPFLQQHSASLRIWHWLTFLVICGSIVTVLFNSTILNPRDNIQMVQEQLNKKGVTVTNEQAFAVSHEYEDKMWEVHKYFGFALALLFLARVVIEFTQPEDEKIMNKYKKAVASSREKNEKSADFKHYVRVRQTYMLFFVLLFLMALTGLSMAFGRELQIPRNVHGIIKNVHSFIQYLIYAFIFVHLAGVILAENGKFRGVVSGMINGNK